MKKLLAQSRHTDPVKIYNDGYQVLVELPNDLIKLELEYLENGRALSIARCAFFDDYLGISPSADSRESTSRLQMVIEKHLNKLSSTSELFLYLKKKKFVFSDDAALEAFRKPVKLHLSKLISIDHSRRPNL